MNTEKNVIAFLNNKENIDTLRNLKYRWDEEKDFEDWNEYDNVIKCLWNNPGFVKSTKRPFGFKIEDLDQDRVYHIFLKFQKNSVTLMAKVTS